MNRTVMSVKAGTLAVAVCAASGPAFAAGPTLIPVLDAANLAVNTTTAYFAVANTAANVANAASNATSAASNLTQNAQLAVIKKQLKENKKGTVVHHTINIDNRMKFNTEINQEFTWIINRGDGGDEIIPIPFDLSEVMGNQDAAAYTSHYKAVTDYKEDPSGYYGDATALEASRARKAANDALVHAIESDDGALKDEADALKTLAEVGNKAEGHGKQLQVANALGAAQINQLMRLRSLTLVSEAARAAEAQAAADREARATAIGIRLRKGLDSALTHMKTQPAVY